MPSGSANGLNGGVLHSKRPYIRHKLRSLAEPGEERFGLMVVFSAAIMGSVVSLCIKGRRDRKVVGVRVVVVWRGTKESARPFR